MKNEYGVKLDSNGYAPSIWVKAQDICFLCNRSDKALQRHEVFHGPNRTKSKKYGLWVCICYECHGKIHQKDSALDRQLKAATQRRAQLTYGWSIEDFRERFGKNYREHDDE